MRHNRVSVSANKRLPFVCRFIYQRSENLQKHVSLFCIRFFSQRGTGGWRIGVIWYRQSNLSVNPNVNSELAANVSLETFFLSLYSLYFNVLQFLLFHFICVLFLLNLRNVVHNDILGHKQLKSNFLEKHYFHHYFFTK